MNTAHLQRNLVEVFSLNSGVALLARDLAALLRETYGRTASTKSIGRNLSQVIEDHPNIQRTLLQPPHRNQLNANYTYQWAAPQQTPP